VRVLFITSECGGLAKAGGLGEATALLPRALRASGTDVRILMPAYRHALAELERLGHVVDWKGVLPGRRAIPRCRIGVTKTPLDVPLYLIDAPELYDRPGTPYSTPEGDDWPDNHLRFARLSLAASAIARGLGGLNWLPDLVHANDWPGGLAGAYSRWDGTRVPTVMAIHNIGYQGLCEPRLRDALAIPEHAFNMEGVEFHGSISFLKAGIYYADHVAAVSPTYANEIATEEFGAGLHGLIRTRSARGQVSGIANGIDESWDPSSDPLLPTQFHADNLDGKRVVASSVRECLCLRGSDGPLFGVVSRLVHQKGLDLIVETADHIVGQGGQIALLGLGNPDVEQMLSGMGRRNRENIGVLIGFNAAMERRILGASDFCLMPSRYEPCGLTQMHAQRYGALPVARATGGLSDTIEDGRTGFLFSEFSGDGLKEACRRAFDAFTEGKRLAEMRKAAMAKDFSWSNSAENYRRLYNDLLGRSEHRARHESFPVRSTRQAIARDKPLILAA
jgi:starch synthase